ncbi:hypothetical protein FB565_007045 [Actinoplanes lutulentus]|uniref:Tetratricopeptide repeat protein n=1 Tax=Actinoplanes lutulentus TaxID=1287878 RepID=A0A327ZAB9_9ACTN|nr:tetratricopeptide repeat protein [Actinoplanes lutulentus]MBB2947277.1 hypothetical protein [Actinoplanes lutulentus]RAK36552.1 tetratricopeptide repeat protein [Actinoplanes lutulentus]
MVWFSGARWRRPARLAAAATVAAALVAVVVWGRHPLANTLAATSWDVLGRASWIAPVVEAGNHDAAIVILRQLLAEQTRLIGADHADSLTTRRNLADALEENSPREAAAAYQRLLDDCVRIMGTEHSYTLVTRCEVVKRDADHDNPQQTVARFEELLGDCRRILGSD